jgi:hypothetical protein
MDGLVSGILGLRQAQVMGQVQIAVARKIMDVSRPQGAAAVQMIEAAGEVQMQTGDDLVAAATGLGGRLDIHAYRARDRQRWAGTAAASPLGTRRR